MMESPSASSRTHEFQRRTTDGICRAIALILDGMERRQEARDRTWREALCAKTACRRAGQCRGVGCLAACAKQA